MIQVQRTTPSTSMPQTCASAGLSAIARIAMPVRLTRQEQMQTDHEQRGPGRA